MPAKKLALSLAGAATLMAGGAAAYWQFVRTSPDAFSPVALAQLVPQATDVAAYVSTDAQSWAKLDQFGTPKARQEQQKALQDLQQRLLENQIDLDKDLSWAGNAMVALMPPGATDSDPDLLVVVGIKDKISALNFAKKLESQPDVTLTKQQYKGTEITHSAQKDSDLYTAVLGNYLVLSPEQAAVERSIDTQQGQPSLAAQPNAKQLLNQRLDLQNSVAQFYVLNYAAAVQNLMAASPTPIPSTLLSQLNSVKSVVGGLGIDDVGIRLKAQTELDPATTASLAASPKATPGAIVSQFPADTLALVSGIALNQYWSQLVQQANSTSEAQLAVGGMRQAAKAYLNLDLDKEIFSWMDGEFALGMVPATQGLFSQAGVGGRLVFDTSNRKAAEATLTKLDGLARKSFIGVNRLKAGGGNVTEWTLPGQGALLQHGWLDNDSLFVAVGGSSQGPKPSSSLESSDSFKSITASLPKKNLGYVYLDVEKMLPLLNKAQLVSQPSQPAEVSAALESVRGIAITSTQPSQTVSEVEMLLALKPAQK